MQEEEGRNTIWTDTLLNAFFGRTKALKCFANANSAATICLLAGAQAGAPSQVFCHSPFEHVTEVYRYSTYTHTSYARTRNKGKKQV